MLDKIKRLSIICGHYGSGKTNVAVNMALSLKEQGENVTIIDLDIVNPYFRTADFEEMLTQKGIKVVTPIYANTNLDIPALPPQINTLLENENEYVIVDVGGDDAGAIALGRYSKIINNRDYDLFYVVNANRYLTQTSDEATELLGYIETSSRVKATGIINNSNLGELTSESTVLNSLDFANEICQKTGLPLAFTCIDESIKAENNNFYKVKILINKSWKK